MSKEDLGLATVTALNVPGGAAPVLPAAAFNVGVVPKWNLDDLVARDCPVCGSDETTPLCRRPDALDVETCTSCGMRFIRRVPSDAQLHAFYQDYATFKGYTERGATHQPLRWLQCLHQGAQSLYVEALERTGGIRGKTVLDVGCSVGRFLELVRWRGGQPFGVEIDGAARKKAQSVGLAVTESFPAGNDFDVVCAFDVLEHLSAPLPFLEQMVSCLRPGGRLLLAVPNGGEVDRLGSAWVGFRVDLEHLNFFSASTLATLLGRLGLYVEHCWEYLQPSVDRVDVQRSEPRRGVRGKVERGLEWLARVASPPPARFLDGRFALVALARRS